MDDGCQLMSMRDGTTASDGLEWRRDVFVVDLPVFKGKRWDVRGNWSKHDGRPVADVLARGGNRVRCRLSRSVVLLTVNMIILYT